MVLQLRAQRSYLTVRTSLTSENERLDLCNFKEGLNRNIGYTAARRRPREHSGEGMPKEEQREHLLQGSLGTIVAPV